VLGDRGVERGQAEHAAVLVVTVLHGANGGLLDEVGAVEVGKALAEIDGAVLDRETGHLREDGGAEALQPRAEVREPSVDDRAHG
jgi:hypothetical protein